MWHDNCLPLVANKAALVAALSRQREEELRFRMTVCERMSLQMREADCLFRSRRGKSSRALPSRRTVGSGV